MIYSTPGVTPPGRSQINKNHTVFMMLKNLFNFATGLTQHLTPLQWWGIAIVLVVIRQLTQIWLDGLYLVRRFQS
ncbi:MAG: hypothetical protein U1B30_14390 [Pseudomonadota bacterium]|nr:hypothetical protein [Pseudomonadota bacterium]